MSLPIYEVKRNTLIKYSRKDTPSRASRSDSLSYRYQSMDDNLLKSKYDVAFSGLVTGGARGHETIVTAEQILENLRQYLLVKDIKISELRNSDGVSILAQAFKENDVKVHCDCEDFKYRFGYSATIKNYNIDAYKENRPAKITNPNNKGALCKHLLCTFKYNSFIRKGTPEFIRELKANESKYLELMNLEYVKESDE